MEYYVEQPKKKFSYTILIDNIKSVHTDITEEYMDSLGLSSSEKEQLIKDYTKFMNQLEYFEKKWANKILSLTDFMMIEDATYKDFCIRECFMYQDIKEYRKALREYKDKTKIEDRPKRPKWLKKL